jgi:hypothetical protein
VTVLLQERCIREWTRDGMTVPERSTMVERMPTPKGMTPREVIDVNLAWLYQIAKDALEYDLVTLNKDLTVIADSISESLVEMDKKAEAHKVSEEFVRATEDAINRLK